MKSLILIVLMIASANAMSMDRGTADQLLLAQGLNLARFEQAGSVLLLGEVTGGGRAVPMDSVQAILLEDRAIIRNQIGAMDFKPASGRLADLDSFRAGGVFFTKEDIRGVVVRKK